MKHLTVIIFLLVLTLDYGFCTITCTGDLSCTSSNAWCLPGDKDEADSPILIPTNLSSKTEFHCISENDCFPCTVVELEISLTYLTEGMKALEGEDCDSYDKGDDEEGTKKEEASSESQYLETRFHSNDSFICANFFISQIGPHSSCCIMVDVRMPISSIPFSPRTGTVQVGKLEYSCLHGHLSENFNILAYTLPRYHDILKINHSVPGCLDLGDPNKVSLCKVPLLDIIDGETNTSIGIFNGSRNDIFTLDIVYKGEDRWMMQHILNGDQRFIVLHEDIVPCMCFKVSWSDITDAVKYKRCPFEKELQYEDNTWKNSNLTVSLVNSKLLYTLEVWCPVMVEISLCWRNGHQADCHEIPGSRRNITAQRITEEAKGLHSVQHSICVQVKYKDKIWHTNCTGNVRGSQSSIDRNNFLIVASDSSHIESPLCIAFRNMCLALNSTTLQELHGVTSFEMKILQEFKSGECELVWRGNSKEAAYVCSLDKYMRKRWNLAWILCLTFLCCALFVMLLKRERVKRWLKKIVTDKPLDTVFQKRKVLILYSPDHPAYGSLVHTLATSLQELSLTVVLDQWDRVRMCQVGAISWFHQKKSLIYKENGIIILLFSEGGKQILHDWGNSNTQHGFSQDPYGTFGSILNCVYPDFQEGMAPGHYLVASFDLLPSEVPQIFHSVPVLSLPSQLMNLLKELAGNNKEKLSKKQLHQLSGNLSKNLQRPISEWQRNSHSPSISELSSSQMSVPFTPNGCLSVEVHPLI
ncbi:interleukin-17 receptor C isoform X2 [Xenopus laevis]|uniref:Interleukin-17 receptor C isoform X2 n=1 Tax=Xenopus laevis TaxID=8355 RepID=A0A8J1KK46_XENLA|nr:interleukin-17 receptor C isoform X2 [Xenopus laevis]